MTAIDYLHESNCGDTPFDGKVVVVGGGNVAIDASRVSSRNKANQVHQFCLEQEVDMPASNEEIAKAREDGVTIHCGWGPKEIIETNGKVSGLFSKNVFPYLMMKVNLRQFMMKIQQLQLLVNVLSLPSVNVAFGEIY